MAFIKLFASILDSTVWCTPASTRLVWITMLAMADRDGVVGASVPGLANRAGVPLEDTEAALACFLSPDKYSRTPDNEGRRIEAVDGGWRIYNYAEYRSKYSPDEVRAKSAKRQAEYRARKGSKPKERPPSRRGMSRDKSQETLRVHHSYDIAEAEGIAETNVSAAHSDRRDVDSFDMVTGSREAATRSRS